MDNTELRKMAEEARYQAENAGMKANPGSIANKAFLTAAPAKVIKLATGVLALLDELDKARAEIAELRTDRDAAYDTIHDLDNGRMETRRIVEQLLETTGNAYKAPPKQGDDPDDFFVERAGG